MRIQKNLISIIIPMYNVENSIEKSVKSIQNSTYKNVEIILIDDGSSDKTLEVCRNMQEKDDRIKIVEKENSGAGLSREYGLGVAQGKYIGFVDADDYIEPEMYEKLNNRIVEDKLDACFCGNYEVFSNGDKKENNIRFPQKIYVKEDVQREVVRNAVWFAPADSNENPMFSIWRGLYSIELIKNNDIHFLNEREIGSEDGIFNFQCLCNVERLGFIHECLYNYAINEDSLTHNTARWEPKYEMRSNNWYKCIADYSKLKGVEEYVIPYLNAEYLGKVRKCINILINENKEDFKKLYKEEKKKFVWLKDIRILKTKGNGIRNKIDFILCFYFIKIYCYKYARRKQK